MNPGDAKDLKELCDKVIADVQLYRSGTPYEKLGLVSTFRTICTPLLHAGELDPEIRSATPAVKLHELRVAINRLGSAMMLNKSSVEGEYLPALFLIREALDGVVSASTRSKIGGSTHRSVFYSWQATLSNRTNRGFIRECLEGAAAGLNSDVSLEDSVRIDSDTSGRPGSPKIFPTILAKIDACDIFVADVSFVSGGQCNSNVMVELGYALKTLGEGRILMIFNEAYGEIRDLPFDLSFNRQLVYRLGRDDEKATERKKLTSLLKSALKSSLGNVPES